MRKVILAIAAVALSTAAVAGGRHGHAHPQVGVPQYHLTPPTHVQNNYYGVRPYGRQPQVHQEKSSKHDWFGPFVVGAILGAVVTQSNEQPPVTVGHMPVQTTRYVDVFIPECNCHRSILVPIN